MSNALWVLGADDPEMTEIERLLVAARENYCYATCNGARVYPGSAYKADGVISPDGASFRGTILRETIRLVECGFVNWHEWAETGFIPVYSHLSTGLVLVCQDGTEAKSHTMEVVSIDHHRPGDPGHGTPPERFLEGSSLGQVMSVLAVGPATAEQAMVAAADHCLEAAYRGRCPGVDPDALMRWRAASRAEFQKRPRQDVLADIEVARVRLRKAVQGYAIGGGSFDAPGEPTHTADREYADLRGHHIPELPEAACREGIPFLSTVRDRDGREKVVLQASPPDLVRRFLAGELVPGLHNMYGSPERGLAGGYTTKKE